MLTKKKELAKSAEVVNKKAPADWPEGIVVSDPPANIGVNLKPDQAMTWWTRAAIAASNGFHAQQHYTVDIPLPIGSSEEKVRRTFSGTITEVQTSIYQVMVEALMRLMTQQPGSHA